MEMWLLPTGWREIPRLRDVLVCLIPALRGWRMVMTQTDPGAGRAGAVWDILKKLLVPRE